MQLFLMGMRPEHDIKQFNKTRNDCCRGSAENAEGRHSEFSENQYIIADQIHSDREKRSYHRRDSFTVRPYRRIVGLCDCERKKSDAHHREVAKRCMHGRFHRASASILMQVQADQITSIKRKNQKTCQNEKKGENNLQPKRSANTLIIPFSAILGCEDANARKSSENT